MLALVSLIAGAVLGWWRAAKRGGVIADRLQYAIGHAIAFGLAGYVLGVVLALAGLFPGA